ncbi:hypothetical protein LCGC14_0809610 [marine sediment metagenome]|uniref:Uncharacterized protein n=1 Tax=marine sediment metagenome TaxID=412755 RepID=A0A0F9SUK3_9ZZZZ
MGDKPWKVAERKTAAALGGVRNRMSGAIDQLTAGDVVHPNLYVEVKYRIHHAAVTLMKDVEEKAEREAKTPVVVLQERGADARYYIVREEDFPIFVRNLAKAKERRGDHK